MKLFSFCSLQGALSRHIFKTVSAVAATGAACLLSSYTAHAQTVELIPELEVTAAYSDNYFLLPEGGPDRESFITALKPRLSLNVKGRRSAVHILYEPAQYYFEDLDDVFTRHNLRAGAYFSLFDKSLRLEANADIAPRFVGQAVQLTRSDLNFSEERRSIQNYAFGPSFERLLTYNTKLSGSYRFGILRSNLDRARSAVGNIRFSDSNSHAATLALEGRFPNEGIKWTTSANFLAVDRSGGSSFERFQATGEVAVEIIQNIYFLAEAGYFNSDATRQFTSGEIWQVGVSLEGKRTQFLLKGGQRSGTTTFTSSLDYKVSSYLSINGRYSDELETSQSVLSGGLIQSDFTGGNLETIETPGFDFTDIQFRRRRGDLGFDYKKGPFQLRVATLYEERNFDEDIPRSESYGGTFASSYKLRGDVTLGAFGEYRYSRFSRALGRTDDLYRLGVSLTFKLAENIEAFVRYDYADRNSNQNNFDDTENLGQISLSFSF